jgi:hypothetical protein
MRKLFLAVLCAACVAAVFGQEPAADSFEIRDNTLVRYTGNGGAVVIPPGVTAIGDGAFADCGSLSSVSIPASGGVLNPTANNGNYPHLSPSVATGDLLTERGKKRLFNRSACASPPVGGSGFRSPRSFRVVFDPGEIWKRGD